MKCPFCQSLDTNVTDSRPTKRGVRRRRRCPACQERFTTIEVLVASANSLDGLRRAAEQLSVACALINEAQKPIEFAALVSIESATPLRLPSKPTTADWSGPCR